MALSFSRLGAFQRRGRVRALWARLFGRCDTAACWSGALAGALPHVLHTAGPLAGTSALAGAGGTLVFAVVGLAVSAPLLWHERRRTQGWRTPVLLLAASAGFFVVSTIAAGEILGDGSSHLEPSPTAPTGVHAEGHG